MKKFLLALALPALLASCAPAVMGAQPYNPVALETPFSVVRVAPGQTVFVQIKYPRAMLGVSESMFDAVVIDFTQRVGVDVASPENRAEWLKMTASDLPKGVNVELVQAGLLKDIRRTKDNSASVQVNYAEVVRVVLKVTAEPGADLGPNIAELNFSGQGVDDRALLSLSVEK
ncbi:hypothetical protein [Deinococcus puniceus]|uniref:Lipoprotein n=1 Tax=Deinococcus puniceus TaxID=1182568 RepID=A0A172TAZ3_9DEIO|nr:hypothetical protein [Deinococcus puniceus]ANE44188.1 hypothetical protein SU48_10865 [Deinococcus puniceus]